MSETFTAIVEIPTGSYYKYEIDKVTNKLTVDRPLMQPIPYNYGYLENTLSPDGDALDVCIINVPPIISLTSVRIIPIGVLICDDNGVSDDKIIAVIHGTERSSRNEQRLIEGVIDYLSYYKKGFKVLGFENETKAIEIYDKCVVEYQNNMWDSSKNKGEVK